MINKILLIIGVISWTLTKTAANQLEVCATCEWLSIKSAIAEAGAGDTLLIKGGVYKEGNIVIDKPLYIKGVGYPVVDGDNQTEVLTIRANGVSIDGLQIQNVGTSYIEDRAGIRVQKSRDFTLINNRLINTFFGIYLEHSKNGVVRNNEVIGEAAQEMSSGNAIHLWYCKKVVVDNNVVSGHRDGIYFEFVDESLIKNNVSEHNLRYGLHFMFSNDDEYFNNTFRFNGAGVAVMFSRRINMRENIFEYNWGRASYGLLLKEIYDADIKHNIFRENTIGIYVEGSNRINYQYNDFRRNGWAIKVSGGCLDNVIEGNNFIGNTFDLSINSALSSNRLDGNYWSEYSGYDLDRDGLGDVPYRPVKLFNYVVNRTPEAMVLLRSLFVDIINFSEKVSPVFTPANVFDHHPVMKEINKN